MPDSTQADFQKYAQQFRRRAQFIVRADFPDGTRKSVNVAGSGVTMPKTKEEAVSFVYNANLDEDGQPKLTNLKAYFPGEDFSKDENA